MLKKYLLAGSLISLVIGYLDLGTAPQWGLGYPMAAVFFILCFIVTVLERETALYDAEEKLKAPDATKPAPINSPAQGAWKHPEPLQVRH
jgi:hypothetical protein